MNSEISGVDNNFSNLFKPEKDPQQREIINLSGYVEWEMLSKGVRGWLADIPARRMVLFPDISPTEPGVVPTGVLAEIDMVAHPEWRKFIRGADIGCGMLGADLPISQSDFQSNQQLLDNLFHSLKNDGLDACFGGNHFVNFAAAADGRIFVLIHTGSYGDMQKKLSKLIENPQAYDAQYLQTIQSGIITRQRILAKIEAQYGRSSNLFDTVHNTIQIDSHAGVVKIYKGVVNVQSEGELQILPSSLSGRMIRYRAGMGSRLVGGTSHGTGRSVPRSQLNLEKEIYAELYGELDLDGRIAGHRLDIMVPTGLRWPVTEIEEAYHDIGRSVELLLQYQLASPGSIEYLTPIAGIKGE